MASTVPGPTSPDSITISVRSPEAKRLPITAKNMQHAWKPPIRILIKAFRSSFAGSFRTSKAFVKIAWSGTRSGLWTFNISVFLLTCCRTSWKVSSLIGDWLMVGKNSLCAFQNYHPLMSSLMRDAASSIFFATQFDSIFLVPRRCILNLPFPVPSEKMTADL